MPLFLGSKEGSLVVRVEKRAKKEPSVSDEKREKSSKKTRKRTGG